jgi:hypothetical protein
MANTGAAPKLASTGPVIGPVFNCGGLQYWYLACFPDAIVAVRHFMGAMFILGMANDDGATMHALFGLSSLLVNHLLYTGGRSLSAAGGSRAAEYSNLAAALEIKRCL